MNEAGETGRPLLVGLTAIALVLLASNSLFTRLGVSGGTDPLTFAAIRVASGACMLGLLCRGRGLTLLGVRRWGAALALVVYLFGFSLAYRTLDAGVGALILFAVVQIGLVLIGVVRGEGVHAWQWVGMVIALAGLVWLLWPSEAVVIDLVDAGLMALAGLAWAFYTLAGRFEARPLAGTASNFLLASAAFALCAPLWFGGALTLTGALMATASGAIGSGVGYAVLYRVLPEMSSAVAGATQLAVPVIAILGGVLYLGEVLALVTLASAALVLAGIAIAILSPRPPRGAATP